MSRQQITTRQLAIEVVAAGHAYNPPVTCSASTIGHLMTGHIKTTHPERALLIEELLDAPQGSIFDYKVSTAPRGTRTRTHRAHRAA